MKKLLLNLLLAVSFYAAHAQTYVWTQKNDFGGGNRFAPFYFSIGDKGYVGCGVTFSGTTYEYTHKDFWEYDGALDTWTQMADMPDTCRSGASGFTIGNKGYVTTGWIPSQINTTFEYDPSTNVWTQKANYGGAARYSAACFSINSFAYVGMGYSPLMSDFWKYDPSTDAWTQVADIGGSARQAASGFAINGYGYVFGGTMALQAVTNELWQYDPTNNSWTLKAPLPGPGRYGAAAFTMNGLGYVGLGNNLSFIYNDFYTYDPINDSWIQIASVPFNGRYAGYSFSFANAGFVGGGAASLVPTADIHNDLWRLELTDANTITGKLYYDFNNNQIQDAGEFSITNKLISESASGRITFSGIDGSYNLEVLSNGNYTVATDSSGYFAPIPTSYNINFSSINEIDSLNDFAFQASTIVNDLSVSICPWGGFRPGFDGTYNISYSNIGTTTQDPIIYFVLDTSVTYVSSSVTPTTVGTDTIVWNLSSITPFQSGSFTVTVNVNPSTPLGTLIHSPVIIEPIIGDVNTSNNSDCWDVIVVGSCDPNDIQVSRAELTTTEIQNQPYLDYLIRFQNTGTDTAFTVDVRNVVPQGVDLNSFELVSTSHPVSIRYDAAFHTLGFKFNDIQLVDSNRNEKLSHGFIRYRIKPLTNLNVGDIIENTAAIYFDFNPAVLTNTAITTIVNPLNVSSLSAKSEGINIYPNPNNGIFYVKFNSHEEEEAILKVFDVVGKRVLNEKIKIKSGDNKLSLNKTSFETGIYFLSIRMSGKTIVEKFVVNK